MELLLYISASVALLALAGLFIFLIFFIKGTRGLLDSAGQALERLVGEISGLRGSLQGTVQNLEGVTGRMQTTMDRVNAQLDDVEGILGSAKHVAGDATDVIHGARDIVVSVLSFADNMQGSVQRPLNEVATLVSALGAWLEAFRLKLGFRNGRTGKPSPRIAADEPHAFDDGMPPGARR